MNHCKEQLDTIQIRTQQTADYLLEIMKAFDIKKPDNLELEIKP